MSPKLPYCKVLDKLPPCPVRALFSHLAAPPASPEDAPAAGDGAATVAQKPPKASVAPPRPPMHLSSAASQKPLPFTLHEALRGNDGLETSVRDLRHAFAPHVRARLELFVGVMARPKQALQHLLELFILHVCQLDAEWHPVWTADLVHYLAAAADALMPPTPPVSPSVQWTYVLRDRKKGRVTHKVPQLEDGYPVEQNVAADHIIHILSTYAPAVSVSASTSAAANHSHNNNSNSNSKSSSTGVSSGSTCGMAPLTHEELAQLPGLMDEPAKTAVMAYAWFLAAHGIPNGWLRPYLSAPLGRRERAARVPRALQASGAVEEAAADDSGGRCSRYAEELHTLYAPPYLDRRGHLVWYTVRAAAPGEIIGRLAASYARGPVARIDSCRDAARSVQIHFSHVCNFATLNFRLWATWGAGKKALGAYRSLGIIDENDFTAGCPVTGLGRGTAVFDAPVPMEQALAAGFRIVEGKLITPSGKRVKVWLGDDGLYRVRAHPVKGESKEEEVMEWRKGIKFA